MSLARSTPCTGRTQARENVKGPRVMKIGLTEHPGLLLRGGVNRPVPKQKIPLTLWGKGCASQTQSFR